MSKKISIAILAIGMCLLLACSVTTITPATGANETQVALQVQLTVQAGQQATLVAQLTEQSSGQQVTQPTPNPQQAQPPPQPTSTADLQAQMSNARILVYEDTMYIGQWIQDALDNMGLPYTHVNDAIGDFMENLNSGIQWDLIIVGAESKEGVQGEFWDVISTHINGPNKTALIAEIWYLDLVGEGRIKPILSECGITYQRDWPQAEPIYWLAPTDPVFNKPNTVLPFLHYSIYWENQAGDLIKLSPGSEAILLAGTHSNETSSYGVLASCFDGRVIFQTFSNHDYRQNEVIQLWENFITNVLTNHFAAQP